MTLLALVGFFGVVSLGLYTYVIYPLSFFGVKKSVFHWDASYRPTVTLIISAYNEEKCIREKIENSLALRYPSEKLEIIVADDGSTDNTARWVNQYPDILLHSETHMGKAGIQNGAVQKATGKVLVFSDANTLYKPDALQKLVRWFKDPAVGGVCGELNYTSPAKEKSYWSYERWVKKMESRKGLLLGANGGIYAVRRELYEPVPKDSISDFLEPVFVLLQGKAVIYDPEARAMEEPPRSVFHRKKRIILRTLHTLHYIWPRLRNNPLRTWLYYELFFHKLLRWCLPWGLVLELLFCGLLASRPPFQTLFYSQIGVMILSVFTRTGRYFWWVNGAAVAAWWGWWKGENVVSWRVDR